MNSNIVRFPKIAIALRLISVLVIFGIFFIPFATGLKMSVVSSGGDVITTYSPAFSFIFGGKINSEHISYTAKSVSGLGITAFVFVIFSMIGICASLFIRRKNEKLSKLVLLGGLVLLLTASIMMLSMHREAANVLADAILGEASEAVRNTIYKNTTLSFGFLGVGIFGLINCLLLIASFFFDGTVDQLRSLISSRL